MAKKYLQEKLIAGTNITIGPDGKTISATGAGEPEKYLKTITKSSEGVVTITDKEGNATSFQTGGGSGGGVSQDYVDTQDQAILATCRSEIETKATKDYVDQRDEAYATMAEEKLAHETSERQEADQQFASAIEELGNTKENSLIAGTNIEIDRDTQPGKTIIKAINGGSGVSQEYVDEHDASTLASSKTYTDEKVLVVSQALDTVAANLATETTERRNTDNEIKEDLITETTARTNGDTQTLASANAYTDSKIGDVETVLETLTTGSGAN